jgi:hypothetical protein
MACNKPPTTSSQSTNLVIPLETGTFQYCSSKLFNQLPEIIKDNKDYISFIKQVKTLLYNNAKERLSSYARLYCIYNIF